MTRLKTITATPVLDTSAYATGDRMGSVVTLSDLHPGFNQQLIIRSINVIDLEKQNAAFDIMLFNALPTVASADNAAIDISDAEVTKLVGVVPVATGDYTTAFAGCGQATKANVGLVVQTAELDNTLYMLLVSRGSPTYAAGSLVIKIAFEIY